MFHDCTYYFAGFLQLNMNFFIVVSKYVAYFVRFPITCLKGAIHELFYVPNI